MRTLCWLVMGASFVWAGDPIGLPHDVREPPRATTHHPCQQLCTRNTDSQVEESNNLWCNDVARCRGDHRSIYQFILEEDLLMHQSYCLDHTETTLYDATIVHSRKKRSFGRILPQQENNFIDNMVLLLTSLILNTLADKSVVLFHDAQPVTLAIVHHLMAFDIQLSMLHLDLTHQSLVEADWMGVYNDGFYVHILLFQLMELVETFASMLTPRLWAPQYLLLISANSSTFTSPLLAHPRLNRSPFFSLLQPHDRLGTSTKYYIMFYESFRRGNKIRTRGFYRLGETHTIQEVFPDRFPHFYGHRFHVASWIDDFPYLKAFPGEGDVRGMCLSMLQEMARRLNFNYRLYDFPPDNKWGDFFNGSWRGLIGEVYREEKDFGINQMGILRDRNQAIDFSVPYWVEAYTFLLPIPQPPPRWWSISFPFSWTTWVALLLILLLVTAVHIIFIKVKAIAWGGVSQALLEVVRTVLRQDASHLSADDSVRVFQGVWRLLAMIVSISYMGNLIAYITAPPQLAYLHTLQQLASSSLKPVMVDYGSYIPHFMRTSIDPAVRRLGQAMEIIPYDYSLALSKVEKHGYALLEVESYLQYVAILKGAHGTYMMAEKYKPTHLAWYFPWSTPWKHKFDLYISSFRESGLCHYWKEETETFFKRWMNYQTRGLQEEPSVRPLALADCQGAFLVYGVCVAAAVLVGLVEVICVVASQCYDSRKHRVKH